MKTSAQLATVTFIVAQAFGCVAGQTQHDSFEVIRAADAPWSPSPKRSPPAAAVDADEAELGREVRLVTVLRLSLKRNPDILEAKERAKAGAERALAVSRLPDLEFKYEQWGVPLSRPYALGEANTLMFGLRQSFPAPGTLDSAGQSAVEDAKSLLAAQSSKMEDVRLRVQRAFFEYYRAEHEYLIHLEHVELASALVDLARSSYQAGRGSQQDVLRIIVELSRLHTDVSAIEQERASSRAMLNALMARAPDASLGPPEEVKPTDVRVRLEEAERNLTTHRPELVAAEHAVRRSQAIVDGAQSAGRWPAFMVGADYWYMPTQASPHAYGAMVSMSLPWLNPRHGDEVREAEHTLAADARALESVRNVVEFELRDAAARLAAARAAYTVVDRDLLPQARQSFEAAQAAYATGKGDALGVLDAMRSYLQVRIEEFRALARIGESAAALERAVGTELPAAAQVHDHE